jgi:hypothetical protein
MYKNKNIQFGGMEKIITDGKRKLLLSIKQQEELEQKINTVSLLELSNRNDLGDFLFYNRESEKIVTEEQYDFLYNLVHNSASVSASTSASTSASVSASTSASTSASASASIYNDAKKTYLTNHVYPIGSFKSPKLNEIETVPQMNISDIHIPDHGFYRVPTVEYLINLLNLDNQYLHNNDEWNKTRIGILTNYLEKNPTISTDPITIFNTEKINHINKYEKIRSFYPYFETYYTKHLILERFSIDSSAYRMNMGKIILNGKIYMYKQFTDLQMYLNNVFNLYNFISNCNKIYFKDINSDFNLEVVSVPMIAIFSESESSSLINSGYLMEIVESDTVRDIIKKYPEYWILNKEKIKHAIINLILKLSGFKYLINDFAYDNVMWSMTTNTLTYIDISDTFNRDEANKMNLDLISNIERDSPLIY